VTTSLVTSVDLAGAADLPLLVVGPSLGTSVTTLWSRAVAPLHDAFHVVGWELPGHGENRSGAIEPFTMAELAAAVLALADEQLTAAGRPGGTFAYAGDSVGGAVGQQLLLDVPDRIDAAVLVCTAARFGDAQGWRDRAALVRSEGTAALLAATPDRWFGPGFAENQRDRADSLLADLAAADAEGYAKVCEALAGFDVRDRLGEVRAPVLAVAGACDVASPVEWLTAIADGVRDGRLVVLEGVGHLAPAEAPDVVATLLRDHLIRRKNKEYQR
jgi:3-oxoadipate enol-lactonase / 4-carboxymuconolactone decarboxylase